MKQLFLLLLLCCGLVAQATGPLRNLRLRTADGRLIVQPSPTAHARTETRVCPSHLGEPFRHTRTLSAPNADGLGRVGQSALGVLKSVGAVRIPVIMVEFPDVPFQESTTPAIVDSLFNRSGYKVSPHARGSVSDYFKAQSYGKFQAHFDIVGKITTQQVRAYYGKNSAGSSNAYIYDLYREAVNAVQQQGFDFSPYVQEKGVPLVVLFHAGPGEHDSFETGREDYIWAHFSDSCLKAGGTSFNSYLVGCELMNTYQSTTQIVDGKEVSTPVLDDKGNPIVADAQLVGIGVFCHEMCHALGLPDFYSTDEPQATPDFHDLMDYGQYGNEGYRPVGLSAYERNYLGWLPLEELTDVPALKLLAPLHLTEATDAPQGYVLRNPNNEKEYYILENRQPHDWFFTSLGSGMLIHHIDYDERAWRTNSVNVDGQHLRYTVVAADGKWQNNKAAVPADYAADFFPGPTKAEAFTSDTRPAMTWYTPAEIRPIYNIQYGQEGRLRFAYMDHTLSLPPLTAPYTNATLWQLDGRRVPRQQAAPGIYIEGGRKILVR